MTNPHTSLEVDKKISLGDQSLTAFTVFAFRLEFDAYRSDMEELSLGPRDAATMVRIEMAQHDYQIHRDKYERLRSDVTIKLKFLEENKVCIYLVWCMFSVNSVQLRIILQMLSMCQILVASN